MDFKSKLSGKAIKSQSREIVSNVLEFMKKEAVASAPVIPLTYTNTRVAVATGISERTLSRIISEKRQITAGERSKFSSPQKTVKRSKKKTELDKYDKGVLKRTILNMHTVDKICPTLKDITTKFCEATGYDGSRESLRQVIKTIGFRWKKTQTNRQILVEHHEKKKLRINYLRMIRKFREEGRPIIYMDETHINSCHREKVWTDDSSKGLPKTADKGQKLVIVHAADERGLIPDACLIIRSGLTRDYHDDIYFLVYEAWLLNKLIPHLPPKSVLVIDNAPYHNKLVQKIPTSNSRKQEMKEWLLSKNIYFDDAMLKTDLFELVRLYKPKHKQYRMDEILLKFNHNNILRLPPYYPDLNPIKLFWTQLKQYVGKKNVTCRLNDIENLCKEFIESYSADKWRTSWENTKMCEKIFLDREAIIEETVENFIINIGDYDPSSSDSDSELSGLESS